MTSRALYAQQDLKLTAERIQLEAANVNEVTLNGNRILTTLDPTGGGGAEIVKISIPLPMQMPTMAHTDILIPDPSPLPEWISYVVNDQAVEVVAGSYLISIGVTLTNTATFFFRTTVGAVDYNAGSYGPLVMGGWEDSRIFTTLFKTTTTELLQWSVIGASVVPGNVAITSGTIQIVKLG